jgi:hypothetical protein
VRGIHIAFEGVLAEDVEMRCSPSGKDWAHMCVTVVLGPHTTQVAVAIPKQKAALGWLNKGIELYVEGRLSPSTWTRDAKRTGLAVSAWRIEPLGWPGGRPGRSKARRERAEAGAFDDVLVF